MNRKFQFIILLLMINYAVRVIETLKIFPLSDEVCKEILQNAEIDISDVNVLSYNLDAKSTLYAGQSLNQEIFRLFIDYEKNSQTEKATFLIKAPISSVMYNFMYSYGAYEKEYALYSQVFPEMLKLEGEYFSAKFIAGDDTKNINTMVLEDVYTLGYKAVRLFKPFTLDECRFVFEKLAKLHALSVVLDKTGLIPEIVKTPPKPENELSEEAHNQDIEKAKAYFDQGMNHFVENLNSEIKEKYAGKLDQMKDNITDRIHEGEKGSLHVLAHGNLMAPHILFKHKEDDSVENVLFLDFTGAKWNSPLIDIFYFLISSMTFEDVEEHFDTLLGIYSKVINDVFKKYEIEPYTLDDMKNDMLKQHMTLMWICGVILPLISDSQLPIQIDGYSFKEPLSADNMMIAYKNEKYVDTASKWFMFFVKRGIIPDN